MNCKNVSKIVVIISSDINKNIHLAHAQKIAF